MEDIVKMALEQAPSLAVLVFLVVYFIRYLKGRDEEIASTAKECHKLQEHAIKAIEENSRVIGGVTEVIRKCNGVKV